MILFREEKKVEYRDCSSVVNTTLQWSESMRVARLDIVYSSMVVKGNCAFTSPNFPSLDTQIWAEIFDSREEALRWTIERANAAEENMQLALEEFIQREEAAKANIESMTSKLSDRY